MEIIWKKCKRVSSRKIILSLCSTTVILQGPHNFILFEQSQCQLWGCLSLKKLLILSHANTSHWLFHPFPMEENLSSKTISQGPQLDLSWCSTIDTTRVTLAEVLPQYPFHVGKQHSVFVKQVSFQLENTISEGQKIRSTRSDLGQLQGVPVFPCPGPLPNCECFMEARIHTEDWKHMAAFPCGISAKYLFLGPN